MNRLDRLFALVLQLQARGMVRAHDLACDLQVSQRTVYRDMQALSGAGVPIVALPGQGYALTADYFLPPLLFTGLEAGSLALGADHVARALDAPFRLAASTARSKLTNVLTADQRRDLNAVQARYPSSQTAPPAHPSLHVLREAILDRQALQITYHAFGRSHAEQLEVEPYGLLYYSHSWQLLAYSRQRQAPHLFRLDRIDQVTAPAASPEYREGGSTEIEVEPAAAAGEVVEIRVASRSVRALLLGLPGACEEQRHDGAFTDFRVDAPSTERLLRWILQWAGDVEVLRPAGLRRRVAALGSRVAALHAGDAAEAEQSLLGIG